MTNKHLHRDPIDIEKDVWYYEEPKGISVYVDIKSPSGDYMQTKSFVIPWGKLKKSVERKLKQNEKEKHKCQTLTE